MPYYPLAPPPLASTPLAQRPLTSTPLTSSHDIWWRSAVVYQIYVRSFADGSGDGTGDLAGVRARLPYLRDLGVDALWFTPFYVSPLADGGYDVVDYRAVDPTFGDLAEAEALIAAALDLGIRTIVDIVPNHVSDQHRWFRAALAAGPGSTERERFWFRPGRGEDGEQPPTGWISEFGGGAWTRTTEPDGTPGEWYLHLFTAQQPDLNWNHPEVRREHEEVLRFWLDRGASGFRIDSAALLVKDPVLPEVSPDPEPGGHPFVDRDELHEIYRSWRAVVDSYPGERVLVGEVWLPDASRFARYLRADEMHTAFNFDFMAQPWDAGLLRTSIDTTLAAHRPVDAPATWVLSNHDVTRPVTRYGRTDSGFSFASKRFGVPSDPVLGLRRAKAAALLTVALPGSLYLYQGDELGLPEVELPQELLLDPMHIRSGGVDPGREGCRVPLPWERHSPSLGFSPLQAAAAPWLPQPEAWGELTVDVQEREPNSMLGLYRRALALRRSEPCLGEGTLNWLTAPGAGDGVLSFARGETFVCAVNLGHAPIDLPPHTSVLLASDASVTDQLPADTAVWLRTTQAE